MDGQEWSLGTQDGTPAIESQHGRLTVARDARPKRVNSDIGLTEFLRRLVGDVEPELNVAAEVRR